MSDPTETFSATPICEMIGLAVARGQDPDAATLDDVNWQLQPGEYWAVGGLPGSGKSLLLETAAALLRPARGTHRLFGSDVAELRGDDLSQVRRRIGLVFGAGGRLFNDLTVGENVLLPIAYDRNCAAGEALEEVRPLLDWMGLTPLVHHRPARLTADWRQRVALARALALQPAALLLDNPLNGLEGRQLRWWLAALARLAAGHPWLGSKPIALVVACEDLRPFVAHAQRFAALCSHRFVPVGGAKELQQCPEPVVRELLGEESLTE
ncbi:MAG: ATP-binding cassette domain-containing protein [Verrucomicrobia bacterium]|nr:ATP-binding cassette domain-containing protein [Verrucomicrobiota bacterium]